MMVAAPPRLWLCPSTRSMQALVMRVAAEDHVPPLVATLAQRMDMMQLQITPAFPSEEIAQSTLTVA